MCLFNPLGYNINILFFIQVVSNVATGSFLVGSLCFFGKDQSMRVFVYLFLLHLLPCFYPVPSSQLDVVTKLIDGICERFFSYQKSQNTSSMCL